MKITDKIAKAYLEGEKLSDFCDEWYFTSSTVARNQGENIFKEPMYDEEHRTKAEIVCRSIEKIAADFVPTNREIWDALFPNWKEVILTVNVDLIVGFPEPYDAIVERDEDGVPHVIFDVICWTKYVGKCDIIEVVQNLLTHELCHVLIGSCITNIDRDTESTDYQTNLDAITFHEAFAHLVSFKVKEIDTVDWHTLELEKVREKSNERLKKALTETIPEIQQQNLHSALCGNYFEKFACMSGMLYLAQVWENGGNKALKECFDKGYHGFADRVIL